MDAGQFTAAIDLLKNLTEFAPDDAIIHATLGRAHSEAGSPGNAIEAFRKATELDPYSEVYSLGLFHCLWDQQKHYEALEETKRFMRYSDSADYRRIVAEIRGRCGE
jgi:tetratricopeptide (TPR) repeat protein